MVKKNFRRQSYAAASIDAANFPINKFPCRNNSIIFRKQKPCVVSQPLSCPLIDDQLFCLNYDVNFLSDFKWTSSAKARCVNVELIEFTRQYLLFCKLN